MGFARAHPRLIALIVLIDTATLKGLSWAPFDSYPGHTLLTDLVGILSLLFHLVGYFLAAVLAASGFPESPMLYVVLFIVALLEWSLIAKGVLGLVALKKRSTQFRTPP